MKTGGKTEMDTDAKTAGSSEIIDDLKRRLDELRELLEENYITESEYAAARTNALWKAGVDVAVRAHPEPERIYRLEARSRRTGAGRDYRRFVIPGLLIAGAAACALFFFRILGKFE